MTLPPHQAIPTSSTAAPITDEVTHTTPRNFSSARRYTGGRVAGPRRIPKWRQRLEAMTVEERLQHEQKRVERRERRIERREAKEAGLTVEQRTQLAERRRYNREYYSSLGRRRYEQRKQQHNQAVRREPDAPSTGSAECHGNQQLIEVDEQERAPKRERRESWHDEIYRQLHSDMRMRQTVEKETEGEDGNYEREEIEAVSQVEQQQQHEELQERSDEKAESHPFRRAALTDEQGAVVDAVVAEGRNAVVNAVAGSGKTRTALTMSLSFLSARPDAHVLLLAYNKRLQEDMSNQLTKSEAGSGSDVRQRLHIRTIHSLGRRYFDGDSGASGMTGDGDLHRWQATRAQPVRPIEKFGLIIVDEAQDLTPVLFGLVHYVVSLVSERPQVVVLGDPFQLLYRFRGADEAYLLHAADRFGDVAAGGSGAFRTFKLSVCFRITHEMAAWINENLNPTRLANAAALNPGWFEPHRAAIARWWADGIRASPTRPPAPGSVQYLVRPTRRNGRLTRGTGSPVSAVAAAVRAVFERHSAARTVLLAPAIGGSDRSPVRLVTNALHDAAWCIEDGEAVASAVRAHKHIASTVHKFKGCERDAVILLGMDAYTERAEMRDPRNVFNCLYVGATRARKHLLIVQWDEVPYATHSARTSIVTAAAAATDIDVARMLVHAPYDAVLCEDGAQCIETSVATNAPICAPAGITRDDLLVRGADGRTVEDVSAVIAVAISIRLQLDLDGGSLAVPPAYARRAAAGKSDVPASLAAFVAHLSASPSSSSTSSMTWPEVLRVAAAFAALRCGVYARWRQVGGFHRWPVAGKLDMAAHNLASLISSVVDDDTDLRCMRAEGHVLLGAVRLDFDMAWFPRFATTVARALSGVPDIVLLGGNQGATIVEVRTGDAVDHDDALHVACYGAMWCERHRKDGPENTNTSNGMPRMLVVYANIGVVREVRLVGMCSRELLHRVACRKLNVTFDPAVIDGGGGDSSGTSLEAAVQTSMVDTASMYVVKAREEFGDRS